MPKARSYLILLKEIGLHMNLENADTELHKRILLLLE